MQNYSSRNSNDSSATLDSLAVRDGEEEEDDEDDECGDTEQRTRCNWGNYSLNNIRGRKHCRKHSSRSNRFRSSAMRDWGNHSQDNIRQRGCTTASNEKNSKWENDPVDVPNTTAAACGNAVVGQQESGSRVEDKPPKQATSSTFLRTNAAIMGDDKVPMDWGVMDLNLVETFGA